MKRFMRLGSIAATIAAAIVAVAWVVKDRLTGPAPAPAAPVRAPRPEPSPAPTAPAAKPKPKPKPRAKPSTDDLSEINGIGPVYKTKLAKAGITSFADLAAADATAVAENIEAPVSRVQAWIDAARRRRA
ncbi:MAG: helix-hairpin-helix domain-containing protein [Acidimicrobiia bacterium]|nr:helix-hairpin-helix domain-containing protein [Acidimicrobiia bacterium]